MNDRLSITDKPNRFGKFILTYHSFLSSFVIGAAGLVATSIWQYRQAETAAQQAASQAHMAAVQADNSWRIERAEILSKNLNTLSSTGKESVEQRYGVLLSLARGNIIDAELAVSYALELGKDSPPYMESVLVATQDKSYTRLVNAYELSCQQRFGVTRDVPICPAESSVERSLALSDLFSDETEVAHRDHKPGPAGELLADERSVQNSLLKLAAVFGQYLGELFERRQLSDIEEFEKISVGARLISALVLAPTQPNAFVGASEAAQLDHFHDERAKWLQTYLFGSSCNGDCKGKLIDVMLTWNSEAEGRYNGALHELFTRPRGEVAMALARLHSRLLQCQVDDLDATALRDHVLVPALAETAKRGAQANQSAVEDLLSLLALTPDPALTADTPAQTARAAWTDALAAARTAAPESYNRAFTLRRVSVQVTRKSPPPKLKRSMFCTADAIELADAALDE